MGKPLHPHHTLKIAQWGIPPYCQLPIKTNEVFNNIWYKSFVISILYYTIDHRYCYRIPLITNACNTIQSNAVSDNLHELTLLA